MAKTWTQIIDEINVQKKTSGEVEAAAREFLKAREIEIKKLGYTDETVKQLLKFLSQRPLDVLQQLKVGTLKLERDTKKKWIAVCIVPIAMDTKSDDELVTVELSSQLVTSAMPLPFKEAAVAAEEVKRETLMQVFFKKMSEDIAGCPLKPLPRHMEAVDVILKNDFTDHQKMMRVLEQLCLTRERRPEVSWTVWMTSFLAPRVESTEALYQNWIIQACQVYEKVKEAQGDKILLGVQCITSYAILKEHAVTFQKAKESEIPQATSVP